MTAAESGKRLLNLLTLAFPLEGQRQEAQAGRPAFETRFKRLKLLSRERNRQRLAQEGGHFLRWKAQISSMKLLKVITGTPASQRQRGVATADDDYVQR